MEGFRIELLCLVYQGWPLQQIDLSFTSTNGEMETESVDI
jgi:hypothetical protein